jgi:trk system potassium uptake protein
VKEQEKDYLSIDNVSRVVFFISLIGLIILVIDFGFDHLDAVEQYINFFYFLVLFSGIFVTIYRYLLQWRSISYKVAIFDVFTNVLVLYVVSRHFFSQEAEQQSHIFYSDSLLKILILFTFFREFVIRKINFQRSIFNPAQLFVLSFLTIIFSGAFMLMLPNSTQNGISFIDALFTSTSAVCVTGLTVVDTATVYTHFGHFIIMFLIQVGGLGILTFISYFSYFFKGNTTYENQLVMMDMTNSEKLGEVYKVLKNVILITLIIEFTGGLFIYFSLDESLFPSTYSQIFFAAFHSVSAYCNAGFSILSNNLYETGFRYNYNLHLSVAGLIILGGLGFPIVSNSVYYIKYRILNFLAPLLGREKIYKPRVINLSTKIILYTTFFLLVGGTILLFITEYYYTLEPHSWYGKIVTAFFTAVTPRTAGFNTVDMTALTLPSVLIITLLMWIGASPASTGGGIKTSTFAIAIMNISSLAKGKSRLELNRRQIPDSTVRRSFAIIVLSILVIGLGILFVVAKDGDKGLTKIIFESVSAFGTVGLSLGITPYLAVQSKIVLILLMFIGRVGMLTLLVALIRKAKYKNYKYPDEDIILN